MRVAVPSGLTDLWDRTGGSGRVDVVLKWFDAEYEIGTLDLGRGAFLYEPRWKVPPAIPQGKKQRAEGQGGEPGRLPIATELAEGADRTARLIAKAMTRAGWLRPRIDPSALAALLELREQHRRVELILDTNALDQGISHWLVDLFADRCDLVITAISLRELQDQAERAGFGEPLDTSIKPRSDALGSRQLYLAGNRFRENPGYSRVLWRELEVDDAALLLAAGQKAGEKSSAADTMLLRAVRRSVQDRVNGLARLFIVGDTALARRATTELPTGSVVAAQVVELERGRAYFPLAWWPLGDLGARLPRHPARLIWELLTIADEVQLVGEETLSVTAFDRPMWPSDYSLPWVDVQGTLRPVPAPDIAQAGGGDAPPLLDPEPPTAAYGAARDGGSPAEDPVDLPVVDLGAPARLASPVASPPLWSPFPDLDRTIDGNLRLRGPAILDVLSVMVSAPTPTFDIPSSIKLDVEQRGHLRQLLRTLDIAEVDREARTGTCLGAASRIREAWRSGDLDGLYDVLRGWNALREVAEGSEASSARTAFGAQCARSVAGLLGQGAVLGRRWCAGARRPGAGEVRATLISSLPSDPNLPKALSVEAIVTEVLPWRLGVSPVRAVRFWDALVAAGAFNDFEFREGGSPRLAGLGTVAQLDPGGWKEVEVDLPAAGGYRDVVWRG